MGRQLTKKDRHGRLVPSLPTQDLEFRSFFDTVDEGRLIQACLASEKERVRLFAEALQNNTYEFKRLHRVTLASKVGVTLKNLLDAFREFQTAEALATMAANMPKVAADIAEDAQTKRMPCPVCDGQGRISRDADGVSDMKTCAECWGTGELRQAGDVKAREQMLEALEMTGKKAPLLAQQINVGDGFSVDSLIRQGQKAIGI